MKITQVRHGKLSVKGSGELLQKNGQGHVRDDVVDIEKKVHKISVDALEDEQRGVQEGGDETSLGEIGNKPPVPCMGACLRPYRDLCK